MYAEAGKLAEAKEEHDNTIKRIFFTDSRTYMHIHDLSQPSILLHFLIELHFSNDHQSDNNLING